MFPDIFASASNISNARFGDHFFERLMLMPVSQLKEFSGTCTAPANTSGWFIPSPKEFSLLCHKDVDDIFNSSGRDNIDYINTRIEAASGQPLDNAYYWLSTECTDLQYWFAGNPFKTQDEAGGLFFSVNRERELGYCRPILAF